MCSHTTIHDDGQCLVHTHDLHWSQQVLRSWFQQRPAKSCCSWQHASIHHQVSRHILRQKYVSEHVVRVCLFAKCVWYTSHASCAWDWRSYNVSLRFTMLLNTLHVDSMCHDAHGYSKTRSAALLSAMFVLEKIQAQSGFRTPLFSRKPCLTQSLLSAAATSPAASTVVA